jgi:ATP-binding cassette subfamily B protein
VREGGASAWSLLRRFWRWARPYRRWIFAGMATIPVVAALSTWRPLLVKQAIDGAIPANDERALAWLAAGFFGAVLLEFIAQAVQTWTLQRAGIATISDLRRDVFAHAIRLPAREFDRTPIGVLLTRTTSDIEALSETLAFGVITIVTDVVMISAIVVAMFALSPSLAAICLSLAPLLVILVRWFGAELRRLQLEVRKAAAVRTGYITEHLSGVDVVHAFAREQSASETFAALGQRYLDSTKRANIYDSLLFSLMDGIAAFAVALLLWFAAPAVLVTGAGSVLSLGLLFAFVDYLQRVFVPIREFSGKLATVQRAAASLERVYALLDKPAEPVVDVRGPDPLASFTGGLVVRDLHFAYGETAPDVLRGVDFEVRAGQVVAIVGRTGSGKSSLGRVLTRLYEGYRGSIALDTADAAIELRDVPPAALRRHVLMVPQDPFLFDDDVAFNVSLGEDAGGPEALRRALDTVQALDLVDARGGLDFHIGERGRGLSVGEGQLVAFARVCARQPTLLVLDEATASVDSLTEHKVQAAIERLFQGRTVLVIAHRLSTVRHADVILVMDAGRIAERGTHDELVARGGLYAKLVKSGFAEDEDTDSGVATTEPS